MDTRIIFMKSVKERIIYITGTGLGSGYAPVAPGTAGSLLGLLIYIVIPANQIIWVIAITIISFIGVAVSSWIERDSEKDPSIVVIDEICGQWVALLFLPRSIQTYILAFLLFRIFDIWKPFPISRTENLSAGWGIMADDIAAGILANLILHLLIMTGWIL